MKFKNFLQSEKSKHILTGIGIAAVTLFIFQAGMFVGYKKASFSFRAGDNFYRTFGERGFQKELPGMGMMDPTNAHGTIGEVVSIVLPKVIIADRDGVEKTILVDNKTDIRRFRDSIKPEDIKAGEMIMIIGEPDTNGQIEARLVRIMPPPPSQIEIK